jgi:aerobic C4-dicarboxylate transport protein
MTSPTSVLKSAFTTHLFVTVLVAIVLGAALGFLAPDVGAAMQPLGTVFIDLIRMLIGPVVFCTIVTGIASAGELTSVGKTGLRALVYFEGLTTLALVIGLVVMDAFGPGRAVGADPSDLALSDTAQQYVSSAAGGHWYDFLLAIVPDSVVSAFVDGNVLQVLFVAILFAIVVKLLGPRGEPVIVAVRRLGEIFFGMVKIVMYAAPVGAFGGMAYAVGAFGARTLLSLGWFIGLFWITGVVFMVVVIGAIARLCGLRVLRLYRYFKAELLITLGTSNYEVVMPQLIAKLERLGAPKRTVGLVVPSGYAFNGDGVCLYLGFASLFIAQAFGIDLSFGQQVALLAVFLVTSKGSAGVAGSGFVILAATLSATGAVPVVGIMLILGVDRFLSTMRGLVSLSGQIMGSLVVSRWEGTLDLDQVRRELSRNPDGTTTDEPRTQLPADATAPVVAGSTPHIDHRDTTGI